MRCGSKAASIYRSGERTGLIYPALTFLTLNLTFASSYYPSAGSLGEANAARAAIGMWWSLPNGWSIS